MTSYVQSSNGTVGARDEVLSPELALIDPELARKARSLLPDRISTGYANRERLLRVRAEQSIPDEPDEPVASRRVLVGVAVVAMLAVLLFDVRVEVGEFKAAAEPEALETTNPESLSRGTLVNPPPAPRAARPEPKGPTTRRFAWAPADGASGYYVEFFRGPRRVYARETAVPALEVPARWRYEGAERSFSQGEYRWYVWPVFSGQRASRASVQTTVSIPRG